MHPISKLCFLSVKLSFVMHEQRASLQANRSGAEESVVEVLVYVFHKHVTIQKISFLIY